MKIANQNLIIIIIKLIYIFRFKVLMINYGLNVYELFTFNV